MKVKRLGGMKPRSPIARPRMVVRILDADDLLAALHASGYREEISPDVLETSAEAIDTVAQLVLTAHEIPGIGALRATRAALQTLEQGCSGILEVIQSILQHISTETATVDSLAQALAASRDPLAIALRNAAQSLSGGEPGEVRLSRALIAIDELMVWARAAGAQFEAGISREKTSRAAPTARSPARAVGIEAIKVYQTLTGRPARYSRESPSSARQGTPSGPLVRFLAHVFASLRQRVAGIPAYGEHAQDRAWSPDGETLASWITQSRKTSQAVC